jgi:hypothetical protein
MLRRTSSRIASDHEVTRALAAPFAGYYGPPEIRAHKTHFMSPELCRRFNTLLFGDWANQPAFS